MPSNFGLVPPQFDNLFALAMALRPYCFFCITIVVIRGGVEDTRLEAKAKDTKKSEAKAKDSLSEDRHSRGQGQECSRSRPRPRTKDTSASALQKKKDLHKNFSGAPQNFNNSKNSAVLEPRTGQFLRT